ncbi:MAG TPA: YdiU family protein [Bacillota bacterium]|nr:YdiU family protein [Bacillota bacterium]
MGEELFGWKMSHTYATLPNNFFTQTDPTPVSQPSLVLLNTKLARRLDLNAARLQEKEGVEILAGNRVLDSFYPIAQAYAGHQFGHFTMLGDGRAILLGEHENETGDIVDIQLKGAGKTPYSRGGDGRAGLGPMLREYIMSEGMHGLGIPTSRSLAVVETGDQIIREEMLDSAVLTRVSASHSRVGTFQFAQAFGSIEDVRALADYAILRHDPDLVDEGDKYISFLKRVIDRQANLIAKWQLVGFIHGVMNTDNMTISGETIDYGPCAFMNTFESATVFSSIDLDGRYAFQQQPNIGGWNIARFAEALIPLIDEDEEKAVELAQETISAYGPTYYKYWLRGMREKVGFSVEKEEDSQLIEALLDIMKREKMDYTTTFIDLTLELDGKECTATSEVFRSWRQRWKKRLEEEERSTEDIYQQMKRVNPAIIPRNDFVEEALEAAVERRDFASVQQLITLLENPFAYSDEQKEMMQKEIPKGPFRTFCGT